MRLCRKMKKILLIILVLGFAQWWWFRDQTIHVPSHDITFSYIVKHAGRSSRNDHLPMLIALHGNGDTVGNFYETALDEFIIPARIVLIKGPMSQGRGNAWSWRSDGFFNTYGEALSEAVSSLVLEYPTAGKPVLLGFSGGATMAYYQAVKHGNSYSYIFPISGTLSTKEFGSGASKTGAKVFAFHGTKDQVIAISGGKTAEKILQDNGVTVKFTEFDGGHHGIYTNMKSKITHAVEQKMRSL